MLYPDLNINKNSGEDAMVEFVKGLQQEFIATRDFSLNWNEKNLKSVKVRKGEAVLYDGICATYVSISGETITGTSISLKAAINVSGWLIHSNGKATEAVEVSEEQKAISQEYSDFKGGSFEDFVKKTMHTSEVRKKEIVKDEDLIVKKHQPIKEEQESSDTHKVINDQVEVKKVPTLVNSSTSMNAKMEKRSNKIIRSDTEESIPLKRLNKASTDPLKKERKAFVVDTNTPKPTEGMTKDEIQRIIKKDDTDDNGGVVVKKIKHSSEVIETDGITFQKTKSPTEITIETIVGPSGESSIGGQDQGVIVGKVGGPKGRRSIQQIEDQDAVVIKKIGEKAAEKPEKAAEKAAEKEKSDDYLNKLPENWSKMHWVQRTKFIKGLDDIEFINFIKMVDTLKAVQNACEKRLNELSK